MYRKFNHMIFLVLITSVFVVTAFATQLWAAEQSSATIEVRVSQGDDDAEEDVTDNNMDLSSSDLELVHESHDQIVGIRF